MSKGHLPVNDELFYSIYEYNIYIRGKVYCCCVNYELHYLVKIRLTKYKFLSVPS